MATLIVSIITLIFLFAVWYVIKSVIDNQNIKRKAQSDFNALSAEELIGLVTKVPTHELLIDGDRVDIFISANNQIIARSSYTAKDWNGSIKLVAPNN